MNFDYFIGIDCSKLTLDYTILNAAGHLLSHGVIKNELAAISKLLREIREDYDCSTDQMLICMENTGLYSNPLKLATTENDYILWCEDALELKLRSGRQRSKTDAGDAMMIAHHAFRYADQLKRYVMPNETVLQIKEVSRQRSELVEDVVAWKVRIKEQNKFGLAPKLAKVGRLLKKHIEEAQKTIEELDTILIDLIKSDEQTKRKYDIARSVPGFGPKNTITLMAETEMFDKTPNGKACASYAGLSPNKYESGTSVKRKARTSKACNKRLKTAIHMGAMSLIKQDNIYRQLYDRLRERGRHHLQGVNAVRNKMVTVLYACLRDDTMYQKNLHKRLDLP